MVESQIVEDAIKTLELCTEGCFEIRPLPVEKGAFFFENVEEARGYIETILSPPKKNFYFTINPVNRDSLERVDGFLQKKIGQCTCAGDIIKRRWLPFDIDAGQKKDTAASVEEKQNAFELGTLIKECLSALGWADPIEADSGNGYYLLYRIDLDTPSKSVEHVLNSLHNKFVGICGTAHIDTNIHDANRIIRLFGTRNLKANRISKLISIPHKIECTSIKLLRMFESTAIESITPKKQIVIDGKIPKGNRDTGGLKVARAMAFRGRPKQEIIEELLNITKPPLPPKDCERLANRAIEYETKKIGRAHV